jgi:hypothetical protein
VSQPDDEDRTVADAKSDRAVTQERAITEEEATRVEPPKQRRIEDTAAATEVAPESSMPILKQLRSKQPPPEPANRLAPPVPPSPPRLPIPSAPTDPGGAFPFAPPSAPTAPNPIITDDEATRLAPKADKDKKKVLKPGPPLVRRPVARQALQRIRRFTQEMSAVSVNSKSVSRRRVSRLLLAVLVSFGLVVMLQLYKAFTSNDSAELAKPLGGRRKAEDPGFFDRLFRFQDTK